MTAGAGAPTSSSVDLFWLPLGADGNPLVRWSGRSYEAAAALRDRRPRAALFHTALLVRLDETTFVIEMAPVWSDETPDRGVVGVGAVGLPSLGRFRLFRYEIRRWRAGVIADIDKAVASPVRLGASESQTRGVLNLVPCCPTPTWGLDELDTGEMWNSNSMVAWLLASNGLATPGLVPPERGRAPGWQAGVRVAQRQLGRSAPADALQVGPNGPAQKVVRPRSRRVIRCFCGRGPRQEEDDHEHHTRSPIP